MSKPDAMSENDNEIVERCRLVAVLQAMLDGNLSFFEGAVQVLAIRNQLRQVAEHDPDFDVFMVIRSETDHLPLEGQRLLWEPNALERLEPEFKRTEEWAKSFAPVACRNLITRFGVN